MTNLRLQKRLAASVMKCGKRKIWLDPAESSEIGLANSRQNIRKLIKTGYVSREGGPARPPARPPRPACRRRRIRRRDAVSVSASLECACQSPAHLALPPFILPAPAPRPLRRLSASRSPCTRARASTAATRP